MKNLREARKKIFHYFKRFLSGFFFKMFIKLQNEGENTKLMIKNPLGISSIQMALQSTLLSADKMKIVVNMDGQVLFFDQSDSVKLSFCSSTHISSTFTTILV